MKNYRYKYSVNFIGDDTEEAYEARIPKFPKIHVMGGDLKELHEGVMIGIEYAIDKLKEKGEKIPPEDEIPSKSNGKILLRVKPELHEKLSREAQANSMSLNSYIQKNLEKAVSGR